MTILLIEDEPLIARQLQKMVQQLEPGALLEGPLGSVQAICAYFNDRRATGLSAPDLVISDIQLSDGVSFDAFRQVNLSSPVIFTTAYDEYAVRAFKLNSIDYLLKPIDPDELKSALIKFRRWSMPGSVGFEDQFRQFLHQFSDHSISPHYKRRFSAHYLRQIIAVPQDQVACFLRNELIYLYTVEGKKLITDFKTLDELEEIVDPAQFFRANRQYLVSIDAIEGYKPYDSQKLLVSLKNPNGQLEVVVSKEKASLFRQWLDG